MKRPILFYLDLASPYAYFALDRAEALAAESGRELEWRPMLMWAVLKAHGIASPMDAPAKRGYFVADMIRSAAFHGLPYSHPTKLPLSSHLAGRLFHALALHDAGEAKRFARTVFSAFFTEGLDISDEAELCAIAARQGIGAAEARRMMTGEDGRRGLAAAVDAAVADGVVGSPTFILDGENFFGADRLPQLAWRISSGSERSPA